VSDREWFPVVFSGVQWFSVVFSGFQWFPVVSSGFQWLHEEVKENNVIMFTY
jgi:hypothetical protein